MSQLDLFLARISTSDTREKLSLSNDILNYLETDDNSIECEELSQFIDSVALWINQSNFRVSQNALSILGLLVERMKTDFRFYLNAVLPHVVDRLGDAKDTVREKAQLLLARLMVFTTAPQAVFERPAVLAAFSHKNAKVREELLLLLQTVLTDHGSGSLQLSKLLPSIVKLLSDPSSPVRDAAFNTLVEIYKHVGERVRSDLQKKHNVPPSKLGPLMTMFDQVRDSGQMIAAASALSLSSEGSRKEGDDEADRVAVNKIRSGVASIDRRVALRQKPAHSNGDGARRVNSLTRKNTTSCPAPSGGMDESLFITAFEDVPRVHVFSSRELDEHMVRIREVVGSPANDWDKRIDALKRLRAVLVAGASSYDELDQHLRMLEPALQVSVQDLRSQVVREACITIAYLSQQLGHRVDRLCNTLTPTLIDLIPNSAKVMSTSGLVALRFIVQNTHYGRLITHITSALSSSKSRDIRRVCCDLLEQLLSVWSSQSLERHVTVLQDALRRGLQDADSEARSACRRAYWAFADHFKDAADSILNSLEPSQKRVLIGEMSKSSSSNSLTNNQRTQYGGTSSRSRASSRSGSQENLLKAMAPPSSAGIIGASGPSSLQPIRRNVHPSPAKFDGCSGASARSTSAIDLQAAQRAKARAQYSAAQRAKPGAQYSLPRPRKPPSVVTPSRVPPPTGLPAPSGYMAGSSVADGGRTRTPRARGRITQSQPGSRSSSPSSRHAYNSYVGTGDSGSRSLHRRRRSGIPRSTGTSREPSPHRNTANGALSPHVSALAPLRTTPSPHGRRVVNSRREYASPVHGRPLAAHKILLQSREAESALANALATTRSPLSRAGLEDRSDDSESSSVCSERSYDPSLRRDRVSWHGGLPNHSPSPVGQRLSSTAIWPDTRERDVCEVIACIASTHWSERKDGLLALQSLLASDRMLTASELNRVTDLFVTLFMDTHTKVFSIFLDTLHELLIQHHCDLHDWLHPLITRLFNKLGADLLGSVAQKVNKTLDIVRERFPRGLQLRTVGRFLLDQTQTPNVKVKVAILTYLKRLLDGMEPAEFSADLDMPLVVAKVISWTSDQKSVEVRNGAKAVIVALFSLNSAEFTSLLSQLSKIYQDSVSDIMQQHIRRRNSVDISQSLLRSRSPGSPMAPSNGSNHGTFPRVGSGRPHPDDTENLNPDELYRSLRRTTAEIQNYSFDGGVGKLSAVDNSNNKNGSSSVNLPSSVDVNSVCGELGRLSVTEGSDVTVTSPAGDVDADSQLFDSVLTELSSPLADGVCTPERRSALVTLTQRLSKHGDQQLWQKHFRTLLRLLVDQLRCGDSSVRELSLSALSAMCRRSCLTPLFVPYAELLLLSVLEAQRDTCARQVCRTAEVCAGNLAAHLPASTCVRVLAPIVKTAEFPVNQSAIKTVTRLVEQNSADTVADQLPLIMPALLKAYDNAESSVRKASVFCMVTIHSLCGEEMLRPHLSSLNTTKMKLLNLYIKRAQSQSAT